MKLTDLENARFINLETLRKNGEAIKTPVWATMRNGNLYVWTGANSGKVKRIRNNSKVRVCKSDSRGKVESDWVEAEARLLDSPADIATQDAQMSAKYGMMYRLIKANYWIRERFGSKNKNIVIEIRGI